MSTPAGYVETGNSGRRQPLGWEAPRRAGARRAASQASRGCGGACVVARGEGHVCRRFAPPAAQPRDRPAPPASHMGR